MRRIAVAPLRLHSGTLLVGVAATRALSSSHPVHTYSSAVATAYTQSCHRCGLFHSTAVARFDIKQHEMEKRRRRELEKAGVDPDDEDELPWIAPEEQQRLDEEAEQRRAEEEERRREFLAKREKEDAVKRQRFKEFRAKQIALSEEKRKSMAAKKEAHRIHREEAQSRIDSGEEEPAQESAAAAMAEVTASEEVPASSAAK